MVVGGGPAGSATAYNLARHGVDVLLVDRASFPREKVCGDGLAPRGVRALTAMGVDPEQPGFVRVEGLRVHGGGARLHLRWPELSTLPPYGVVRTRHDLDRLLLDRAVKAGARVWERAEATAPLLDGAWVTGARVRRAEHDASPGDPLGSDGADEVRARFVVACDGASSRFGSAAGVRRDPARPVGVAARRYYRSARPQSDMFESWLDLWDGDRLLPGYGWIFPVGDGLLNVGAGLLNTYREFGRFPVRRLFESFVRDLPSEWEIDEEHAAGPVLSGPLPMGMNRRPLALPGLLIAGDAGGIVNPFNGEGIAYALESGALAAEMVHEALVSGRPGLAHLYPIELRRRYGRYFSVGRAFVRAIGRPSVMRTVTRHSLKREWLMRFLLRVMGNVTDGRDGNLEDLLMYALVRLAPER